MDDNTLNPLPVGTTVHERYTVESVVGRGGLGTVYMVRDIIFGKHNIFALKEMADQSRSARRQFEHEAQWLQALDHNHIPKVREYFDWRARLYLVMDFVDGENLEQKLSRLGGQPMPEEQVIAWILPICDALQYLHTRKPSILHRDVKPANIIVTPAGHPVLVDLGIAKEHLPGANLTATFVRKAGTEGYAPPEQYTSAGKSGPWSDVYALGATLYHLLTTQVPDTAVDRVTQTPDLIRPSFYNRAISASTDDAICRAMALRPTERFQSVAEFAAALSGSPVGYPPADAARGSIPFAASGPAANSVPDPWRSPVSPPPISGVTSPRMSPSRPPMDSPSVPYPRPVAGPANMPSPGPAAYAPSRTPPAPPSPASQYPSFAGSQPQQPYNNGAMGMNGGNMGNMGNMGAMEQALPPLPPTPPSVAAAVRSMTAPSLPNPPTATAANLERIRESVTGRSKTRARREGINRGPLMLGVLFAVILLVVGVATAIIWPRLAPPDRSSPQATITGYFNALEQDDSGRAWQFVAASRNDTSNQGNFTQNLQSDDARYGRVLSIRVINVDDDSSNHAIVLVQATRAADPHSPIAYSISISQYDGTTWLVDSITNQ
jgi:serine/threonine-protein kinase